MFDIKIEESLLEIPDLPNLLNRLHTRLDDEQNKRSIFREQLTEDVKAEFIFGQVVMHSPAAEEHNEVTINLSRVVSLYADFHDLGKIRVEKALIGFSRNDYEPDLAFWKKETADKFTGKMNVYPIPDLVVEVLSPGSENVKRDRKIKMEDYAAHDIPEYWIVDPDKKILEQYLLSTEPPYQYELFKKVTIGDRIKSDQLAGFDIPVQAIFDEKANLAAVKNILA